MQFLHAKKLPLSTQLIGVDGGATRVRACEVEVLGAPIEVRLRAGPRGAEREYKRIDGFETPAELGLSEPEQLGEIQPREREQGWAWIEATAQCVLEVSRRRDAKNVLLGLAMPGLKTADGRGLAFARNGPRIPEFAERLTELLVCEGVELAAPIGELLGDGWCAGVGETWGEGGALHGWRTAYYLGGGTGLAEALVLGGELVPLLDVGEWFPPAWRCLVADSRVEDLLSARAIASRRITCCAISGRRSCSTASAARWRSSCRGARCCSRSTRPTNPSTPVPTCSSASCSASASASSSPIRARTSTFGARSKRSSERGCIASGSTSSCRRAAASLGAT
jgi:hypothetical protein